MQFSIPLTASLLIVALGIGYGIGYSSAPTYQATMYDQQEMGFGQADRFIDARYIDQMAAHHRGAILLAEAVTGKAARPEIEKLATDIKANEPALINQLYQWKKEWYNDARTAKDPVVANLGQADEKIELRFLNALIAHHEAGIVMTKEIRTKSSRSEVLNDADAVEAFLTQSLLQLKQWRTAWYGVTIFNSEQSATEGHICPQA